MRSVRWILVGILAAGFSRAATLVDSTDTREAGVRAAFLDRPAGARGVGMGEAYTASADDATALSWNPGALAWIGSPTATAAYDHLGPDLGQAYLAAAMPVGLGVAAVGLLQMSYGSYEKFDAAGNRIGSGGLSDLAVSAGWGIGHPVGGDRYGGTGVSVEVVREAAGLGTDLAFGAGGRYPVGDTVDAGIAVNHVGVSRNGKSLPGVTRAGAGWNATPWLRVAAECAYAFASRRVLPAAGLEAFPHPLVAFRAGYKYPDRFSADGVAGVTAGLGFRFAGFELDYAYQPFGGVLTSHRIALAYRRR